MKRAFKCNYDAVSNSRLLFFFRKYCQYLISKLQKSTQNTFLIIEKFYIYDVCHTYVDLILNSCPLCLIVKHCSILLELVLIQFKKSCPLVLFRKKGFNFGLLILDSHLLASFVFFYLTLLVAVVQSAMNQQQMLKVMKKEEKQEMEMTSSIRGWQTRKSRRS